jgi:hypothetical protein
MKLSVAIPRSFYRNRGGLPPSVISFSGLHEQAFLFGHETDLVIARLGQLTLLGIRQERQDLRLQSVTLRHDPASKILPLHSLVPQTASLLCIGPSTLWLSRGKKSVKNVKAGVLQPNQTGSNLRGNAVLPFGTLKTGYGHDEKALGWIPANSTTVSFQCS